MINKLINGQTGIMKTKFIKSAIRTASETQTQLPWTRGSRRAAFIAKRAAKDLRKSA
ncbi:MAG: hypothetical protein AAGM84_10885 [Pseudomonadota bacterium]